MAISTGYYGMNEVHGVSKVVQKHPSKATLNVFFLINNNCQKQPLKGAPWSLIFEGRKRDNLITQFY